MSSRAREAEKRREREERYVREAIERHERISSYWFLPDGCADEYMALEDVVGESAARATVYFIAAYVVAKSAEETP